MGGTVPLGYVVRERKLHIVEADAATVRMIFDRFRKLGSATLLARALAAEGLVTRKGKRFDTGRIRKILANRVYLGEAVHKGTAYPGEHQAIVSRSLWDKVQAILAESPRTRAGRCRAESPALLRGLIFGADGRAMSPTHTRRKQRLYRYYVGQAVLKGAVPDPSVVNRVAAGEVEAAVVDQLRTLLRAPEIVVATWQAVRAGGAGMTEGEVRDALCDFDKVWEELFPVEQARIVRLLVERVDVHVDGLEIRLNTAGLGRLVADVLPRDRAGGARTMPKAVQVA